MLKIYANAFWSLNLCWIFLSSTAHFFSFIAIKPLKIATLRTTKYNLSGFLLLSKILIVALHTYPISVFDPQWCAYMKWALMIIWWKQVSSKVLLVNDTCLNMPLVAFVFSWTWPLFLAHSSVFMLYVCPKSTVALPMV